MFEDIKQNIILVTGGAGFIGSHFINQLYNIYKNITIINLDCIHYCSNTENINENIRNDDRYILIFFFFGHNKK